MSSTVLIVVNSVGCMQMVERSSNLSQLTMDPRILLVLTTLPDLAVAERLASVLVESRLAACVSFTPGVRSVYRWNNVVERSEEVQLIVKTTSERYVAVEEFLRTAHPYELPEILAVPVQHGLAGYLSWIEGASSDQEPMRA